MSLSPLWARLAALALAALALAACAGAAPVSTLADRSEDNRTLGYPDQRKVVRDSRGALFMAYRKKFRQGNDLDYHIFVARSDDNGATWAIVNGGLPIEATGDHNQRAPAIAIDARDALHVTWYGNDADHSGENDRQIKYVRSADGGATWSPWVNVAEVAGYTNQRLWQEHPGIAVSDTTVYIIWQGLDEQFRASQAKLAISRDNGATWQPWQNISPVAGRNRSRPTLAVSGAGRLFALAYGSLEADGPQQIVWTTSSDDGASWQPWAAVAPTADDQRHVSVALDAGGLPRAVWRQGRANNPTQVLYSAFDGSAWSKPAHVAPNALAWQLFPSIALAGNTVWVAWTESPQNPGFPEDDPQTGAAMLVHSKPGNAWSAASTVAEAGVYASLRAGRNAHGDAIDVVWIDPAGEGEFGLHHATVDGP